jgi:gamma-glutamyltranspeptidase/glutathione hydrolase
MLPRYFLYLLGLFLITQPFAVLAADNPATDPKLYQSKTIFPVMSTEGMVVTQDKLASRVGAQVLADGGNAIDAAVAVGFALSVVHPSAGNLAGGGFMLVYLADEDRTIAIDYREVAPLAATKDMYLDKDGNVDKEMVRYSHASAGVPGTVMGLHHALTNYGTMTWAEVIAPSIKLASEGFKMPYDFAMELRAQKKKLIKHPAVREIFYANNGKPIDAREILIQKDLATTLKTIAMSGADGFYKGKVADLFIAEMKRGNGLITHEDLAMYKARERDVVKGTYRGYEIASMPPPSSGGLHIIQMLNILENFDLKKMGANSANAYHVMAEAMRYAFADRAVHLGDPDYYDVPVNWIISKEYGAELAAKIDPNKARPSSEVAAGTPKPHESSNTTNFSTADKFGNSVTNTYTLNLSYGSGLMVTGTGMFLNDEMDDFSAKPGVMNVYKLIGNQANAIQAGKVPLSSMSPTIVFKDGKPWILTGGGGGSQIITSVLQNIINMIDFDMSAAEAVYANRMHHQWKPDKLFIQNGISPDTVRLLQAKGHAVANWGFHARANVLAIENGVFFGASDPRKDGGSALAPDLID